MPSVPWRVESSKIFKKNIFKIPKLPKSVPKSIQTCYREIFSKKFYAQCSMEGRVFENFPIFFSKFQKCPKSFPKESKRVLIVIWTIFSKNFCAVFHGRSSLRKFSKKIKKDSNFLKCPKLFPKVSKRVLNVFWGKLSKNFCPVFRGGSSFQKFSKKIFSKFQKCPKVFPKVSKRVLNMFWGKFFEKFYAQCSMEGRVFENFQKKYFQNSIIAQKCSQKYPNLL